MEITEIELWTLNILSRVERGQPVEDSIVELKSGWINPEKAARRIAGHANSAKGSPILWLIGVDEKNGIIGVSQEEFSNWFSRVRAQFDGPVPSVTDVCVTHNEKTCIALVFRTEMAPFVVKNPKYGLSGGGPVEWEVPWREGTATRTAKRLDLLRILLSVSSIPKIEITGGLLDAKMEEGKLHWRFRLFLYIEPISNEQIVIPFHRCKGELSFDTVEELHRIDYIDLEPEVWGVDVRSKKSPHVLLDQVITYKSKTIDNSHDELFINGPGKCFLNGSCRTNMIDLKQCTTATVNLQLSILNASVDVPINLMLYKSSGLSEHEVHSFRWYKDSQTDIN